MAIHIDNNPPYAMLGNNGSVYTPWNPGDGPENVSAQAFTGSSELKEAMGRAGVTGAPRIEIAAEA